MAVVCILKGMGKWSDLMVVYACHSDEALREADSNDTFVELCCWRMVGRQHSKQFILTQSTRLSTVKKGV